MPRLLAEATLRLWEALQVSEDGQGQIYEQVPIGSVTAEGDFTHVAESARVVANWGDHNVWFAYADPKTGHRRVVSSWPSELQSMLQTMRGSGVDMVIVYATRPVLVVRKDSPRPADPPSAASRPAVFEDSAIDQRKSDLDSLAGMDTDALQVAKQTAWALLDIAQSFRILGNKHLATRRSLLAEFAQSNLRPELFDPRQPHAFVESAFPGQEGRCCLCFELQAHAIHGYTGE